LRGALFAGSVVACSLDVEYLRSGAKNAGGSGGSGDQGGAAGDGASGSGGSTTSTSEGGAGGASLTGGKGGSEADANPDVSADADAGNASDVTESGTTFDASVCAPGACKRVFVSDKPPAPSAKLGSVAMADAFCQSTAAAVKLGGTWKAWISDATTSPSIRFARANVPYVLLDGTQIAANWTSLTSSTLMHAINMSELGRRFTGGDGQEVWTGTMPSGAPSGNSCGNWTNESANPPYATIGGTDVTNGAWSNLYDQFCNRTTLRVYCFEQ
jgi:hypothetical protein